MSNKSDPKKEHGFIERRIKDKSEAEKVIHYLVVTRKQFAVLFDEATHEWVINTPFIPT